MRKVIVTGSSGRIGSAIVHALQKSYLTFGVDRIPAYTTSHVGDICDRSFLAPLFNDAYAVIHAAAYHAPHVGKVPDEEFERVNITGTKIVADLALASGLKRLIFTSTTALYGHASQTYGAASWIDESTIPRPKTIYHRTKIAAEKLLEEVSVKGRLKICVIRMSRCFPEPADLMAVYRLHRGIDARDVAMAHKLALEKDDLSDFERFIISGVTPFLKTDCVELFSSPEQIIEKRCPDLLWALKKKETPPVAQIDRVYDSSLARQRLAWVQQYGFEEVFRQLETNSPEVLPVRRKSMP